MAACVFRVGFYLYKGWGQSFEIKLIIMMINPIQPVIDTKAGESGGSQSSSAHSSVTLAVDTAEPKASGSQAQRKAVPFSCFQVLCDFFVFRMNF